MRAVVRAGLTAMIVLGLVLPGRALAQTPAPPASLDDIPSAKREDVTRLLRKVRQRHGEDAVVIQTNLLMHAMQQGSVLATGVRVDKVQEHRGKRYLGFFLESGFVFDDATRDQVARAQIVWATVLEPTLARLKDGLQVKADGLVVHVQSHHRAYRSADELRKDIEHPGTLEEHRFYVLASDVDAVVRGELTARTLLARAQITCDGRDLSVPPIGESLELTPGPQ
jgi:hypothetical protein